MKNISAEVKFSYHHNENTEDSSKLSWYEAIYWSLQQKKHKMNKALLFL